MALLSLHLRAGGLAPLLLVFFATALLWSPLTMMGALAFIAFVMFRERGQLFSSRIIFALLACAAFAPVAVYFQADAARVLSRWMLGREHFLGFYLLFIGLEIPHLIFVLAIIFMRQKPWSGALALSILLLCLIPFYALGEYNDFAMRVSIVPLTILAACFAWRFLELRERKDPLRFAAWLIIGVGAWSPMMEMMRNSRLPAFAISSCDLISSWREVASLRSAQGDEGQYLARHDRLPTWLIPPPQSTRPRLRESQSCWPDHPLVGAQAR